MGYMDEQPSRMPGSGRAMVGHARVGGPRLWLFRCCPCQMLWHVQRSLGVFREPLLREAAVGNFPQWAKAWRSNADWRSQHVLTIMTLNAQYANSEFSSLGCITCACVFYKTSNDLVLYIQCKSVNNLQNFLVYEWYFDGATQLFPFVTNIKRSSKTCIYYTSSRIAITPCLCPCPCGVVYHLVCLVSGKSLGQNWSRSLVLPSPTGGYMLLTL